MTGRLDAGHVAFPRRFVGVKSVILVEYFVAATAIAGTVWAEVATYNRPVCADCFGPIGPAIIGILAELVLYVGAMAALGLATMRDRRRARRGVEPVLGRGRVLLAGTTLAIAGLIAAMLLIMSVFEAAGLISYLA